MVKMDDYKLPGGSWDWTAYNKARVDAGEKCRKCGGFIIFSKGYPSTCGECEALETETREVHHSDSVRCPKCRHVMNVSGSELYELYEEGEHDICCQSCDHELAVHTRVTHSFESPELIETPDESAMSELAK